MASHVDRRGGPRWGGITWRLTAIFVLFGAVLLTGVGAFTFTGGRDALREAVLSELKALSSEKQRALDVWTSDRLSDLVALTASPEVQAQTAALSEALVREDEAGAWLARGRLVAALAPRTGPGQPFLTMLVIEPAEGQVIAATSPREEGTFKETRPFFLNGRGGPYLQSPYYSFIVEGLAMTAAAPIRAPDGRLLAVLAGRLNIDELDRSIGSGTVHHRTDEYFLVNSSHLFITQPRLVEDPVVLRRGVHTEPVRRCLAGESGSIEAADYRGVPVLAVYRWIEHHRLCLIVKMDQAEAFAPVAAFGRSLLLIGGLALLGALLLAAALARTITRPVLALQAAAAAVGAGRLDTRIPEAGGDELALLAREFNAMAARLAASEAELRGHAEDLERRVAERAAALVGAQEDLRESEQRYRMLVEQAGDGIFISDTGGHYVHVNPKACAMLGYTADELLGKHMGELVPAEDLEREPLKLDELRAGKTVVTERRMICKDGALLPVEITGRMLSNGQFQGIARDISERRRHEEALQRERALLAQRVDERTAELRRANVELERAARLKDEFLAAMSHELRTPLNAVLGLTEALREQIYGPLNERQMRALGTMEESGGHLLALINDVLDLAKIGADKLSLELSPIVVEQICEASMGLVAQAARRKQLSTRIEVAAPDLIICADVRRLKQILVNLLTNAVKFTPAGGAIGLEVTSDEQQRAVTFTVWDTGIGIAPEQLGRLFQPFTQVDAGLNRQYEGTGLGLALVQRLSELHGGRVAVESAPGRGSRFSVTLPWGQAQPYGGAEG